MKIIMKKILLLTLFTVGLISCSKKRPSVIERPVFDVWNSSVLEIDKIEMSDSVTVFYIDAFSQPNNNKFNISKETYIRKSGTDEKFLVTHAKGINLNEETIMPDSGMISFQLFFPPLKKEIIKIDFIENDFKIWGIYLLPNAKIKFDPIPKDAAETSTEPLPKPEYSIQPAQVSGRLLGYTKDMEHNNIVINAFDYVKVKKIETALSIAEDGSFSGEITPGFPGIYKSPVGPLFLTPDKETKLYIDLKKRSRYQSRYRTDKEPSDSIFTYLSGNFTSAELETIYQTSEYYLRTIRGLPDFQKLLHDIVNMNLEEFKQYMLGVLNNKLDEIKQKKYSANMQMMMEDATILDVYYFLMESEYWLIDAYRVVNNITITSREEFVKIEEKVLSRIGRPDVEYYSYFKGALNDNMSYLNLFFGIAEVLNVHSVFNLPNGRNKPIKERLDYSKEKWALVLGEDKDDILYDVLQTFLYGEKLAYMTPLNDVEKHELLDIFKNKPIYAETLIAESDRMELLITANSENKEGIMNELPDVPQEQMLDAILAKYKGKVVVVDIWGTWCPSCMQAIRIIPPLKDEMKGKDVVFLYIADGTSPLDTWEKTYPVISGEHYYVSRAQTNYWGIQSYPTYMIYDRQGKQVVRYTDFPGVDVLKREIEKGL